MPVVEAPPLARAVWRSCSVGDEIPATLFEAVAKVLVFVRRIKGGLLAASTLPLPRTYQVDTDALDQITRQRRRKLPSQRPDLAASAAPASSTAMPPPEPSGVPAVPTDPLTVSTDALHRQPSL